MAEVQITPAPTEEEAAAIVAAVEMCWPRVVIVPPAGETRAAAWRFSGRWWARPIVSRRDRPSF